MSLNVEVYIPEVRSWIKEAEVKSGQVAHIKQNLHGDRQSPFYYQLRSFPKSSMVERVYSEGEIKIGDKTYIGVRENSEPEIVANLKKGQESVEISIKTDHDKKAHLYRFTQS